MHYLLLQVHGQEGNSPNSLTLLLLWFIICFIKRSLKQIRNSTLKNNFLTQEDASPHLNLLLEKKEEAQGAFLATVSDITKEMSSYLVKTVNTLLGKVQEKTSAEFK